MFALEEHLELGTKFRTIVATGGNSCFKGHIDWRKQVIEEGSMADFVRASCSRNYQVAAEEVDTAIGNLWAGSNTWVEIHYNMEKGSNAGVEAHYNMEKGSIMTVMMTHDNLIRALSKCFASKTSFMAASRPSYWSTAAELALIIEYLATGILRKVAHRSATSEMALIVECLAAGKLKHLTHRQPISAHHSLLPRVTQLLIPEMLLPPSKRLQRCFFLLQYLPNF